MLYGPDGRPLPPPPAPELTRRVAQPTHTGWRQAQQWRSVVTTLEPARLRNIYHALAQGVGEREHPPNSGLVPTARCCGRRRHRQTNSVRVCSPASRRVAALRPRFAGLTALTPAPRTLVQTGSCRRCPLVHPLHVVVDALFRMTLFPATVDTRGRGRPTSSSWPRRSRSATCTTGACCSSASSRPPARRSTSSRPVTTRADRAIADDVREQVLQGPGFHDLPARTAAGSIFAVMLKLSLIAGLTTCNLAVWTWIRIARPAN